MYGYSYIYEGSDHWEVGRCGKQSENLAQRGRYKKIKDRPRVNLLQLQKIKKH